METFTTTGQYWSDITNIDGIPVLFCTITACLHGFRSNAGLFWLLSMLPVSGLVTEMEMTCWRNFHHQLRWKLSKRQLPVQSMMKISLKWQPFLLSAGLVWVPSHRWVVQNHSICPIPCQFCPILARIPYVSQWLVGWCGRGHLCVESTGLTGLSWHLFTWGERPSTPVAWESAALPQAACLQDTTGHSPAPRRTPIKVVCFTSLMASLISTRHPLDVVWVEAWNSLQSRDRSKG